MSLVLAMLLAVTSFASDRIQATYSVPVPDPSWKLYATFPMSDLKVKNQNGRIRVSYQLPVLVTGVENKIRFEGSLGSDGVVRLEAEDGATMECRERGLQTVCAAKYKKVMQDLNVVEELLDGMSISLAEKNIRMAVAMYSVSRPQPLGFQLAAFREEGGGEMEGLIVYQTSDYRFGDL